MTKNAGARGGGEGGRGGCGCGCGCGVGCAIEGLHKRMKDSRRIIDIVVMILAFSMVELRRRRRRRKGVRIECNVIQVKF